MHTMVEACDGAGDQDIQDIEDNEGGDTEGEDNDEGEYERKEDGKEDDDDVREKEDTEDHRDNGVVPYPQDRRAIKTLHGCWPPAVNAVMLYDKK